MGLAKGLSMSDDVSWNHKQRKKSLILDPVHPRDFFHLNFTYCCEQCVHFDNKESYCTFGQNCFPHMREQQLATYDLTGKMAFCRFLEID